MIRALRMLPVFVAAAALPAAADCAGKALESKVLPVRFKPVTEAALLVEQFLGPCGEYKVSKALKVVTVTEEPAVVAQVAQAIASWDVPPRPVEVSVALIRASREAAPAQGPVGDLPGVAESLARHTRYTHFERIGSATIRAVEGGAAEAEIGGDFVVSFRVEAIDPERGIIRLEPCELFQRPSPREAGAARSAPRRLLGLTVNLVEGSRNLVGATGQTEDRALFLALTAWSQPGGAARAAPPPAPAPGTRRD